jgi:signal peptidase
VVGVIDTGDLTFVRTLGRAGGVTTWVDGRDSGYSRHGDYGDVIVYHKNGLSTTTPIIHRALVYIEYNASGGGFDVPRLDVWNEHHGFYVRDVTSYHTGSKELVDVHVDVSIILNNFHTLAGLEPHSGYITKGDHNREVDQTSLRAWTGVGAPPRQTTILVEPVEDAWVVGVARGELPWFGLIKLWANGQTKLHPPPGNSGHDLALTIALLLVLPMLVDLLAAEVRSRRPRPEARPKGRRRRGRGRGGGGSVDDEDEGAGAADGVLGALGGLLGRLRGGGGGGDDGSGKGSEDR